jgi:transposase
MRASLKALKQRERPADCLNNQLALFNHSVLEHDVADSSALSVKHSEKSRCMMETNRKTYPQKWAEYTAAQVNEKSKFLELLYALCSQFEEAPQHMGRPRIPISDRLFSVVFKVYECLSGRRFTSDLMEAKRRGLVSQMPTYSAISRYLESEELTPILKQMIVESSLPLKSVEYDFAIDSSGFATGRNEHWVDTKWNKEARKYGETTRTINKKDWLKVHLMCGVRTNIVTSVEVTHAHAADTSYFPPLVEQTSQNFVMNEISADKAYSSTKNLQLVLVKGAQPYIPFKSNTRPKKESPSVWKRMFHLYMYNQEWFKAHYHKRSNVEATFSMIKRKFGERLRSKTTTAQANEVLCKVLAHNLCVVIQSMYELGVDVEFGSPEFAR